MGKISIRIKLLLISLVPTLGLMYFIFINVYSSYSTMKKMQDLEQLVILSKNISAIVSNVSNEREKTLLFITSKGDKKHEESLSKQRIIVKELYANLLKEINHLPLSNVHKKEFAKNITTIEKDYLSVVASMKPSEVEKLKVTNALNFYSSTNKLLLEMLLRVAKISTNADITTQIISYYNLLSTRDNNEMVKVYGANTILELDNITDDDDNQINILYSQIQLKNAQANEVSTFNVFQKIAQANVIEYYNKELKKVDLADYNDYTYGLANDTDLDLYEDEADNYFTFSKVKSNFYVKVIQKQYETLNSNIKKLEENSLQEFIVTAIIGILLLLITIIIALVINDKIVKDMKLLGNNLNEFFAFINKEKDDISTNYVKGTDEFAVLTNKINDEVNKTKKTTIKDAEVLNEIDEIIGRVQNGFFTYTVTSEAGSESVNTLKSNINNMITTTKSKIDTIGLILDAYGKYEYDFTLNEYQRKGMAGNIGTLSTSLLAMGEDISMFMATFSNVIDKLNVNTNTLLTTSSSLADSTYLQEQSLEETAKDINRITNSIQENAKSINDMSIISDELKNTANSGNLLAQNTSDAMDEISLKVNQITEAITIIDQIAFQTNILSLNAAVEAATAGEAGKGFAVVAQEVRNLASRSAEAANDIKELVNQATQKADDGKVVSSNMIQGYEKLNLKITNTKEIIDNVSQSSIEQKNKILQINDSISTIDEVTHQNAKNADKLNAISHEVEKLSKDIEDTISKSTFDVSYKKRVCNAQLATAISGYKRDHIAFKNTNFENLYTFKDFKVVDHHSCKLGKWIDEQETKGESFTKSNEWKLLKVSHAKVHVGVQNYITENSKHVKQVLLADKALQIENDTLNVFADLNKVLESNCK